MTAKTNSPSSDFSGDTLHQHRQIQNRQPSEYSSWHTQAVSAVFRKAVTLKKDKKQAYYWSTPHPMNMVNDKLSQLISP